jgi:hypothetical protein
MEPEVTWIGGEQLLFGSVMVFDEVRRRTSVGDGDGFYTGLRVDSLGRLRFLPSFGGLPDTMQLRHPRILASGDTVHVVWPQSLTDDGIRADSVRYAQLLGHQWVRREASASDGYFWIQSDPSGIVRLGDTLFFATRGRQIPERLWLMRRAAGGWQQQEVHVRFRPMHVALVAQRGRLVMAIKGSTLDGSNVWAMRSNDGGRSWSEPVLLASQRSGGGKIQLLPVSESTVAAIWEFGPILNYDSMLVAVRHPDGRWSQPSALHAAQPFVQFRAAAAPTGGFWLLLSNSGGRAPGLYRWIDGRWRTIDLSPLGHGYFGLATLAVDAEGRVHVFATQEVSAADGVTLYLTRSAVVSGSCPP